jgi:hypothetical protein
VEEVIPMMVKKTIDLHVLFNLVSTTTKAISLDLLMSKGGVDTFALVINNINEFWIPMHVTIVSFEVHDTTWFSMVGQL